LNEARNLSLRGAKRRGNPDWRRLWIASPEARNDDPALCAKVSGINLSKDRPVSHGLANEAPRLLSCSLAPVSELRREWDEEISHRKSNILKTLVDSVRQGSPVAP